ncbi:arylsulfotransferase [bacterium BMS3Abin03]|nr:arylsulfotransferase [bacterium BMS3Abin03]
MGIKAQIKYCTKNSGRIITFVILLFASLISFAQTNNINSYLYISPLPGSSMILPESNIIIKQGGLINKATLYRNDLVEAVGSKSGKHYGELILSDDGKTIIFKPGRKFIKGEIVTVNYNAGIFTLNGEELPPFEFEFEISGHNPVQNFNSNLIELTEQNERREAEISGADSNVGLAKYPDDLPGDFPVITINASNNPAAGYTFIAPFIWPSPPLGYLIIVDNSGVPIYYKRTTSLKSDFKLQPNGLLTYFDLPLRSFFGMDSSYNIVDTFKTGNGYVTDMHELQLIPNGHALLMAYDNQIVRMDTVVEGGDSMAVVAGLIIQELDADKNVVFQWRSWDHFLITDATEDVDLTASYIDYVHGNAIELDDDGNLLISCRHMDEITKIDRQTGDIIWRWGGVKSRNNEFTFTNDSRTFSHQHDIRRLSNGDVTLFNNGNLLSPNYSNGLEYQLDEASKTATLVWSYNNSPLSYSFAMGNVQRLENESSVIGWGWTAGDLRSVSEVKSDGSVAFVLSMPDTFINYRAFRFQWKTNLFVASPDSVFFESIPVGDSAVTSVNLINQSAKSVVINGFYNSDSAYSVLSDIPFVLPPNGSVALKIKFQPFVNGYFKDTLHIRSETEDSWIAQTMILAGSTDTTFSGINDNSFLASYELMQNYPNPFNPITNIKFKIAQPGFVTLKVYNMLGEEVVTLVNEEKAAGKYEVSFDGTELATGIYIYRIHTGKFTDVKKLLLLK